MKKLVTVSLLLCLVCLFTAQAEDYVTSGDTLLLWGVDSCDIIADVIGVADLSGWGSGLTIADVWLPSKPKRDTSTHYITAIDTGYVWLRKDCDTTRITIFEGNESLPSEIRLDLNDCRNIYRFKIDTSWAELLVPRLTPEQFEKLMDWLQ